MRKPWRLAIKRRLNKKHQEELDALLLVEEEAQDGAGSSSDAVAAPAPAPLDPKEARKARLEELYQQVVSEYDALATRVGKAA